MKRTLFVAVLASFALIPVAFAHGPGHREGKGKRFDAIDKDGNGSVSLSELTASVLERHLKSDQNNDGRVTRQELEAHHAQKRAEWEQKRAEWAAQHPERAQKHAQRREAKQAKMQARMDERFAELDANKNGAIDKAELQAHAKARFAELDQDRSGTLDRDELRKGHRGFGKHKGHKGDCAGHEGREGMRDAGAAREPGKAKPQGARAG